MKKRLVLAPVIAFFTAPWSLKRIVAVGLVLAVALVPFATAFSAQEVQPAATWIIQTVDSAGFLEGTYTSIALDSNNNPHISYCDVANGDLKYARWTGSTWSIQTVDSEGSVGHYTSIALDSAGNPHISYCDGSNGDLKYARWTGSTWIIQTVDSAGDVGEGTSIALDSDNNPHISYHDDTNYDLKYARWTGSTWSIETADSTGIYGDYTSIALDSSDRPHISYQGNGYLKYARGLGYSVFSVSVNPPSQTVTAGDSAEHTVTTTLLAGSPGTVSLSLDLPPSVGVYTFTPPTGTPTFTSTLTIHTHKTAPAGTYTLNVIATPEVGATRKTSITLEVQACPTLTLDLTPRTVARGQPLLISGRLTPAQATTIRLYYRFPHRTGTWKLATTLNTNAAGAYSAVGTVPASLTPGSYDLVAVWFNQRPGTYAASPVTLLTVTLPITTAFSAQEVQPACTWNIQTVDSTGDVGGSSSIALDSSDRPHISYHDATNGDLKYARWTGSTWIIQTVDSAGWIGSDTSIALDSGDNPHISYGGTDYALHVLQFPRFLKYARWTGSAWSIETVDSAGVIGFGTSIALDSGDNPHISYCDGNYLKYAKWTGSAWSIQTVDSAGWLGWDAPIALDSGDNPHISYYDGTNWMNGDLKYARGLGYSVFSLSVNPPSQTVTAGDSAEHTVTTTLLAGSPGTVSLSLDLPPSVGVYTFTPPTGTPTFTSTLIIHTHKTASAGTYTLNVIATPEVGATRKTSITLEVQACPTLTLDLTPRTVARGQPLLISGRLTPAQTTTIQLYYRYPHRTGPWKLATTINTNPTGYYSVIVTVPASLTPGSYDLVAVWFNQRPGTYAASPVALLTVT